MGWKTKILIYKNRPIEWSAECWEEYLGPGNWDFEIGSWTLYVTYWQADAFSKGRHIDLPLNQGDSLIFVVFDCKGCNCFNENSGGVSISISKVREGWIRNPGNGHLYRLTKAMTWSQAETQAVQWGGHLVTIRNRAEELWLRRAFGPYEFFWIGFNDIEVEGTWKWVSGEAVTYTNWRPGQPDDTPPGEDIAVMNCGTYHADCSILEYGDGWHDWPNVYVLRGIVEIGLPYIRSDRAH